MVELYQVYHSSLFPPSRSAPRALQRRNGPRRTAPRLITVRTSVLPKPPTPDIFFEVLVFLLSIVARSFERGVGQESVVASLRYPLSKLTPLSLSSPVCLFHTSVCLRVSLTLSAVSHNQHRQASRWAILLCCYPTSKGFWKFATLILPKVLRIFA